MFETICNGAWMSTLDEHEVDLFPDLDLDHENGSKQYLWLASLESGLEGVEEEGSRGGCQGAERHMDVTGGG